MKIFWRVYRTDNYSMTLREFDTRQDAVNWRKFCETIYDGKWVVRWRSTGQPIESLHLPNSVKE